MTENYFNDLLENLNCSEDRRQNVYDYIRAQVEEINEQGVTSQKELCVQVQLYCCIQQRLKKLLQETCDLTKKIEDLLGRRFNFLREERCEYLKQELQRLPMVFVTGSSNAGKSSLINEIIRNLDDPRKSIIVPEAETPCTARITKVIYGENPEIRVIDKNGTVIENAEYGFSMGAENRRIIEDFITERRIGDEFTVEVLNPHPLFKSGLLLVDAPGTGEEKDITKPVLDFIKDNKVMALLYVCDGKKSLQQSYLNEIKFLKKHGEYKIMIYVFNKIEHTENMDDDEDDECDAENMGDNEDKECPFSFLGRHFHPDELIKKNTNVLHKHELIDTTDHIVGLSARLSCHVRNGRMKHNHIKKLSANYFYLENVIAESFKNNARALIENVAVELFNIQETTFKALMHLDGHIRYAHNLTATLLDKYERYENELHKELGNVINEFPALTILNEFRTTDLFRKINVFFQDQNINNIYTTIILSDFNKAFLKTDRSILVKCGALVESLKNFSDAVASMCSRRFYFMFNEDVGNGALIRAQKLFELLRHLSSINNSNVVMELSGQCRQTSSRADRAISIMQLALANMLGVVGKKAKSFFPENICDQFRDFVQSNVQAIEEAVAKENPFHSIAELFLEKLNFENICINIKNEAHHALAIGHGSNMQLLNQLRETVNISNPINDEISNIIGNEFKSRFGAIMIQTVHIEFEIFNELNVDLRSITLQDLEVLKEGRDVTIYVTSIKGLENMAIRCVCRDRFSESRWTTVCLDLINSLSIKLGATSKIHSEKNNLEKFSQTELDYNSLLPVKFWSHRLESPERLLIFSELCQCSLLEYLSSNSISYMRKLQLVQNIFFGLRCYHAQGYTNDDLRPETILISKSGHAKINLSKTADPFKPIKLVDGVEVPAFHIHPEMYSTHPTVTLYHDLYAFGILVWIIFEGSGSKRPRNFSNATSNEEQRDLVNRKIFPEHLHGIPQEIAELLKNIWSCVSIDELNGYHDLMINADSVLEVCLKSFVGNKADMLEL